jgi:hypothetical protein
VASYVLPIACTLEENLHWIERRVVPRADLPEQSLSKLFPTIMATIRDGTISTTFNHKKIKAIPELNLPALTRPHPGGAPSVSSSIRNETRNIGRDEPCFITKQYGYGLEKAHFINAVDRDKSLK